jgi:hypothetical protein
MDPIDPAAAAAVRAALGFPDGDEPADLVAAAQAVNAAAGATVMDGGSVLLVAVAIVCNCRHGGATAEAAQAAIARAWPLATQRDLVNVASALAVLCANLATDADLAAVAAYAARLP